MSKICSYCQSENDSGVIFCYECGTQINEQLSYVKPTVKHTKTIIDFKSFFSVIIQFLFMCIVILLSLSLMVRK